MRTVIFYCLLLTALLFLPASLNAGDFGLILNQTVGVGAQGNDSDFDYEAALLPRFSLFDDWGDLFLSASLKVAYGNEEWRFVPELLRAEFSRSFDDMDLRLGRMMYSDPMGIAAVGLFDGARLSRHTAAGTFGIGVWYTGLLYKGRANISMTPEDAVSLNKELDWGDFFNTYFASRRLMAALYWEHPSLAELLRIHAAIIGQADLNNRNNAYHNQYFIVRAALPFERFIFELGAAIETAQVVRGNASGFYTAFATDIGLHWMPPAPFHSMLSFTGRFTSGKAGNVSAFTPVTAVSYGNILNAEIPGLSILGLNYTARLYRTFSAGLAVSYFIRSDTETFTSYPLNGQSSDKRLLGSEFFGSFIWSPVSDMSLNFGAGIFLPSLGNAAPSAQPRWRVETALALALR